MSGLNTWLPFVSVLITFLYAFYVLRRYFERGGNELLLWGIGLVMYAIGGLCEGLYGVGGWNDLVFRLWYLFGAVLVAAWLGQGTVYLVVARNSPKIAHGLMVLLIIGSIYAAYKVFTATLDPSQMPGQSLSGYAITSDGVRILTPFFNSYGSVTLAGGALYSAWIFYRKRILFQRMIGCILIAVGAMAPATGGILSRFGLTEYLYLGEMVGALLMFVGFLFTTRRRALFGSTQAPQG